MFLCWICVISSLKMQSTFEWYCKPVKMCFSRRGFLYDATFELFFCLLLLFHMYVTPIKMCWSGWFSPRRCHMIEYVTRHMPTNLCSVLLFVCIGQFDTHFWGSLHQRQDNLAICQCRWSGSEYICVCVYVFISTTLVSIYKNIKKSMLLS